MAKKWVYSFEEGDATMRNLLGGKGCNLAEMTRIGLPVPPGFTVTTEACIAYMDTGKFPEGMWEEVLAHIEALNKQTGKEFTNDDNPLLVSIRSGARESMPGMMDTILNVGLTPGAVETMGKKFNDMRFAWDLYRRLIQMYSKVVLEVPGESLLLLQTSHSTSSDLLRKRASVGDKFAVDSKGGIKYLRQHQEDQAAYEQAETIARTVGIIIANALGVHLVKTQVDDAALP